MIGPAHDPNRVTLLGRVAPSRHAFPESLNYRLRAAKVKHNRRRI